MNPRMVLILIIIAMFISLEYMKRYEREIPPVGEAKEVARPIYLQCPTCKRSVYVREVEDISPVQCKCGTVIDVQAVMKVRLDWIKARSVVPASEVEKKGCLACHKGVEVINPKMAFIRAIGGEGRGCVICHEGDATANTLEGAHKGLYPNPGNMWALSKGRGCAKCHSENGSLMKVNSRSSDPHGQSNHVYRAERNLMSTTMGIIASTLSANGLLPIGVRRYSNVPLEAHYAPAPLSGTEAYKDYIIRAFESGAIDCMESVDVLPTYEEAVSEWGEPKAMMVDYYRKECARCHLWTDGAKYRGDRRASGCSSCHVLYSNDAFYEGADTSIFGDEISHPLRHEITTRIPSVQCTRCHTRGKRVGTSYVGIMEYPYLGPWDSGGRPQKKLHNKRYIHIGADLHFERGIECSDCHTSIEMHGDGNIYPTTDHEVEIECSDCHGTPFQYPWELPLGYADSLGSISEMPRGVFEKDRTAYILTARGNPFGNVIKNEGKVFLRDTNDKTHEVPLLKTLNEGNKWKKRDAEVAMVKVPHIDKLECYSCHAVWAPQCYGCHLKEDFAGKTTGADSTQIDWLASTWNYDEAGRTRLVMTPGRIAETRSYLRWEYPALGLNKENRIGTIMPGCNVVATFIDKGGRPVILNQPFQSSLGIAGVAHNPAQPHTIQREARGCETCHVDPKTVGYGIDNGRFANPGKEYKGDIPGAVRSEVQIPRISFSYDFSAVITREGKQVQTMSYPGVRPLNSEERDLVERNGLCVGCHQHYGTPEWDSVIERFGRAKTAEEHAEMVAKAVECLFDKD
ncbi:MAG: hypothetical protein ACE5KK_05140 [Candidatus Brocadiales bacterium]